MNAAKSFGLAAATVASATVTAHANFVDLVVRTVDPFAEGWTSNGYDASALDTYRVYAMFDDDTVDLYAIGDAANDGAQFMLTTSDGMLVNEPLGGDFAPNPLFIPTFPSLAWDTFLTIGELVGEGAGGVPITTPAPTFTTQAAGLTGDFILQDTGYYIAAFPPIGNPIDGLVLIAQFTVNEGVTIEGTEWRLTYLDTNSEIIDVFADFVVEPTSAPCPADFDGSGSVGLADLTRLLTKWGACVGCIEDINGSGDDYVGFDDLVDLLNQWGACP